MMVRFARVIAPCFRAAGTGLVRWGALVALAVALAGAGEVRAAASAWDSLDYSRVRLVAESVAVGSAERLRLGLHFRLDPGWKIYWR